MHSHNPVIRELRFVVSGTYNDVVARPYESTVTPTSLGQFVEQSRQGTALSATAIAGVASQLLKPVAQDQGIIAIPHGWGQRRMAFLMTLELEAIGCKIVHYISGYTDRDEYAKSIEGHAFLPPDLMLYINSVVTVRETNRLGSFGAVVMPEVTDAMHIMRGNTTVQFGRNNMVQQYGQLSMRPEDVIGRIDELNISRHNQNAAVIGSAQTFQGGIKTSRFTNSAPANFLSSTLSAISTSNQLADVAEGFDQTMERARTSVFDSTINSNPFFFSLRDRAEMFIQQGAISWKELCEIQPDIDMRKQLFEPPKVVTIGNGLMQRGEGTSWTSTGREVIAATILNHAVPALMAGFMITGLGISITTVMPGSFPADRVIRATTPYGHYDVVFSKVSTYGGLNIDLAPVLPKFAHRLVNELINDLTVNNQTRIELHGEFSLGISENRITLAFDGGYKYNFGNAAFCSSLSVPELTTIPNTGAPSALDRLANDIERLASEITYTPPSPGAHHGTTPTRFAP